MYFTYFYFVVIKQNDMRFNFKSKIVVTKQKETTKNYDKNICFDIGKKFRPALISGPKVDNDEAPSSSADSSHQFEDNFVDNEQKSSEAKSFEKLDDSDEYLAGLGSISPTSTQCVSSQKLGRLFKYSKMFF